MRTRTRLLIVGSLLTSGSLIGCGSQGVQQGRVPDVVGMSRKEASSAIVDAGLRWRAAKSPIPSDRAASAGEGDLVLHQSPAGDSEVSPGRVVVIQTCSVRPGEGCEGITPDGSNGVPLG
jgi:beta-lactam-binding protein with PASTA domain